MSEWHEKGVGQAVTSTFGWATIILVTLLIGFCAGYWIGHREFTEVNQILGAFLGIPFLWLGFRQVILAYIIAFLTFYLPLRSESLCLRVGPAGVNLVTWFVVVLWIVEESKAMKFFHY